MFPTERKYPFKLRFSHWFRTLPVAAFLLLSFTGFSQVPDSTQVGLPAANDSLPEPTFKDTIYLNESDFGSVVTYSARDSIYSDFKKRQIHLYGNASLNYEGVDMKADYLLIDLDKNEVFATYTEDSLGKRIGAPVFADGGDTIKAASIRYNFTTKKGYIQEVAIQQDEIYLTMEVAKRQANEEVHFVRGKFTTCNLEEPHYHFFLSKAVMVPDKRIVTGPMNLWIMGVPTPLGLPFSIIPQKKDREAKNGFIMPQFSAISDYGFGILNLGYYIPVSDRFQTTLYGTIYSRGSFGLRTVTQYAKRYKYTGNVEAGYSFFREGFPSSLSQEATILRWQHIQDPKANPKWRFNSDVNFNSQNTNKANLNVQTADYFNNTLNSDITVNRSFPGKPVQMSAKLSMRQNSGSPNVSLTSPVFNITATRFYPFKRKRASDGKTKFYETVGVSYNFEARNQADFSKDYLKHGDYDKIGSTFRNGATQTAVMNTTINLLKNTFRLTPAITYNQKYNFQSIRKSVDPTTNALVIDSLNEGIFSNTLTFSAGLTTNIYSYYRFIGKRRTLLRHIMTPAVTLSASPTIQGGTASYVDTFNTTYNYSRLENSVYSERYQESAGRIDFSLGNTFEIKQLSAKDTITGFRKTRIIENLNFNTSYDIFKDSMNWSNMNIRMVVSPVQTLSVVFTADHSWYAWDRETGVSNSKYALQSGQGLGRFTSFAVATSWSLVPKEQRDIVNSTVMASVWNPQYQQWMLSPSQIVNFDIPWRLSLSHVISYSANRDTASYSTRRYVPNNTLMVTAEASITPNWRVSATTMLDATAGRVTNTRIDLYRNIHCWNVSFNWTPIGTNKSFLVSIRGNGNALSNVFMNLRKPQSLFQ